jgi:hypothetical protein
LETAAISLLAAIMPELMIGSMALSFFDSI